MVASLAAFFIFNRSPAKIFPGDTLTYSVGALIAIIAITANIEKIAIIIFIPYFIELILKLRGKFQKESFAQLNKDGSLKIKKIYGLEHLLIYIRQKMNKKTYENDVVVSVYLIQLVFILISLLFISF